MKDFTISPLGIRSKTTGFPLEQSESKSQEHHSGSGACSDDFSVPRFTPFGSMQRVPLKSNLSRCVSRVPYACPAYNEKILVLWMGHWPRTLRLIGPTCTYSLNLSHETIEMNLRAILRLIHSSLHFCSSVGCVEMGVDM